MLKLCLGLLVIATTPSYAASDCISKGSPCALTHSRNPGHSMAFASTSSWKALLPGKATAAHSKGTRSTRPVRMTASTSRDGILDPYEIVEGDVRSVKPQTHTHTRTHITSSGPDSSDLTPSLLTQFLAISLFHVIFVWHFHSLVTRILRPAFVFMIAHFLSSSAKAEKTWCRTRDSEKERKRKIRNGIPLPVHPFTGPQWVRKLLAELCWFERGMGTQRDYKGTIRSCVTSETYVFTWLKITSL